jgi:uncharacterized protein DUF2630
MAKQDEATKEAGADHQVLRRIERLAADEHGLYAKNSLDPEDRERLRKIRIELDQCWDLLRQRQALRDAGRDPDQAQVRPPDVVESY